MWEFSCLLLVLTVSQIRADVCSNTGWYCAADDHCISKRSRCDIRQNDCSDNADQEDCTAAECTGNKLFYCSSNKLCLSDYERCDGVNNCADGKDEVGCDAFKCPVGRLKCGSSNLCSKGYICDGVQDCDDNMDEDSCESYDCPEEFMKCEGDNTVCVMGYQCNGIEDCSDGSDEKQCTKADCAVNEAFFCPVDKRCVFKYFVCDGYPDCTNGEDDFGCVDGKHVTERSDLIDRMTRGRKHVAAANAGRERTRTSLKRSRSANVRGNRQPTINTRDNGNVRLTRYHGNGKMYRAQTVDKMRKEKMRN